MDPTNFAIISELYHMDLHICFYFDFFVILLFSVTSQIFCYLSDFVVNAVIRI